MAVKRITREVLEHRGVSRFELGGTETNPLKLGFAPTIIKLINCQNFYLHDMILHDPLGPPDPDGCCIQTINSTGLIERIRFLARPKHGKGACDLLNIYGDDPIWVRKPSRLVTVRDCRFDGRGDDEWYIKRGLTEDESPYTTSINQDGPFPPDVEIYQTVIRGARVGFAHCGGTATLVGCDIQDCSEQTIWSDGQWYAKRRKLEGFPVRPGTLTLDGTFLDRQVGLGKYPGEVVVK